MEDAEGITIILKLKLSVREDANNTNHLQWIVLWIALLNVQDPSKSRLELVKHEKTFKFIDLNFFFNFSQIIASTKVILDLADQLNSFRDGSTTELMVFASNFCTGDAKEIVTDFIPERNANNSVETPKVLFWYF